MQFRFGTELIHVNTATSQALLDRLRLRLQGGRGFAVATLNLDHLVKLGRSADYRAAYAAHDFVVADGNPIVWLSRLAGRPVALAPGADLVPDLARLAARCGAPVALVGSTGDALARAGQRLREDAPGLHIAARLAPGMGFDPEGPEAEALLTGIAASGARLCLLALGAPKQERFAAFARGRLPNVGFVSVGAGLDFLAGHQTRAPRILRRLALEWLWRALSAPRRMVPRYALCAAILPRHALAALRLRRTPPAPGSLVLEQFRPAPAQPRQVEPDHAQRLGELAQHGEQRGLGPQPRGKPKHLRRIG